MPVGDYPIGERIESPDDPDRCQGNSGNEQCNLKQVPGSNFCAAHGGNKSVLAEKKAAANRYRLTKWQQRMQEFSGDSELKSTRDEIGILRILLEERLNLCQTSMDLILHSGPISDIILKIDKVVKNLHEIDKDFKNLLEKSDVIQIADRLINIVKEEVKNPEEVERIQRRVIEVFMTNADSE